MNISCCGVSTTGRRQENEDCLSVEVFRRPEGCLQAIAAVCDGMGGQLGGQTASRLAIEEIQKLIESPPEKNDAVKLWIENAVVQIQNKLVTYSASRPDLSGMGTTLVLGLVTDTSIWIANVGDSRAYRVDKQGIEQLTIDHTAVQDAINRGLYKAEEVIANQSLMQMSSALLHNLGEGGDPVVDIYELPLITGEAFLFCTDGLTGSLVDPLISEKDIKGNIQGTKQLDTAVNNLISIAYQRGSTDNITAVLLEVGNLERFDIPVTTETEVEILRQGEIRQREKIIRSRKMRRLYRRLIPVLTAIIFFLCLTIVFLQRKNFKTVFPWIKQTLQEQLKKDEPSHGKPVEPDILPVPKQAESISVKWFNYDEEELGKKINIGDSIRFNIINNSPIVAKVTLIKSRSSSMEAKSKTKDVTHYLDGNYGNIPLKDLGIKKDIWYFKLILKALDGKILSESEIREIEVVGNPKK